MTRSFDVFFDLRLNKRLSKQSWGWWFETLSRPLRRHRNGHRTSAITNDTWYVYQECQCMCIYKSLWAREVLHQFQQNNFNHTMSRFCIWWVKAVYSKLVGYLASSVVMISTWPTRCIQCFVMLYDVSTALGSALIEVISIQSRLCRKCWLLCRCTVNSLPELLTNINWLSRIYSDLCDIWYNTLPEYIDGLVQNCGNSSALVIELPKS